MASLRTNLFDFDRGGLEAWFLALGEQSFRATQLMRWAYHRGVLDFNAMTDFSKELRTKLENCAELTLPEMQSEEISSDGTRKWILAVSPDKCIETVFIPEDARGTLCVSSQVGCMLDCSFCATGKQGFNGNLTTAQIVGQVYFANKRLAESNSGTAGVQRVTNLVFMGMGEPLFNFDAVLAASNTVMDDLAFGLSRRRVTISTAGLVPQIRQLAEVSKVSLAVSLHAPEDSLRDVLVPLNRKYPIAELLEACQIYGENLGQSRCVTIEYVLIRDMNDTEAHAHKLAVLLRDLPCKINLIPFNPYPGTLYQTPQPAQVRAFAHKLFTAGFRATVRTTRGADINAACGQLAGRFKDRTNRRQRYMKHSGINETQQESDWQSRKLSTGSF